MLRKLVLTIVFGLLVVVGPFVVENASASTGEHPSLSVRVLAPSAAVHDPWLFLQRAGVSDAEYLGRGYYLGCVDNIHADRLLRTSGVRALTALRPSDKLAGMSIDSDAYVEVKVDFKCAAPSDVLPSLSALGLRVRESYRWLSRHTAIGTADPSRLIEIAALPQVVRITRLPVGNLLDERAVELVGGAYSGTGGWVNGEGYDGSYGSFTARVALVDSGIYDGTGPGNHPDHQSRVVAQTDYYGEQGQDIADHGTAVAGIVAGNADAAAGGTGLRDSLGYLWGQGMAPAAQLLNARDVDGFRGFGTTAWSTISTWVETNGGHEMSNSWGTVSWDAYTSDSQEWDAIVRDANPGKTGDQNMIVVFAAGNEGDQGPHNIRSTATAKNVITVGGSKNNRPEQPCIMGDYYCADNVDDMWLFSSRGPTSDGRLKPDLVAPTSWLPSSHSTSAINSCTPDTFPPTPEPDTHDPPYYCWFGGTSGATPQVSGSVALFLEFYYRKFGALPTPATVKAALINSAFDMPTTGRPGDTDPVPNNDEGWGRIKLTDLLGLGIDRTFVQDVISATGQTLSYNVVVSDTSRPLKITLAWSDYPGDPSTPAASGYLVNDIDLKVTNTATGAFWIGNAFFSNRNTFLSTGWAVQNPTSNNAWQGWDTDANGYDDRNNVENVYIQTPSLATYRIDVTGRALRAGGLQPFSLVAGRTGVLADAEPESQIVTNMIWTGCDPDFYDYTTTSFTGNPYGGDPQYTYLWNFDGGIPSSSTARNSPYVYWTTAGTKTVTYTVTDSKNQQSTDSVTVTVRFRTNPFCPM